MLFNSTDAVLAFPILAFTSTSDILRSSVMLLTSYVKDSTYKSIPIKCDCIGVLCAVFENLAFPLVASAGISSGSAACPLLIFLMTGHPDFFHRWPAPMNPPDIEAAHTDLPIDVNPPTKEEIRMAVRQIKNGKAAGPDNIPAEALKSDIEVTASMLNLTFKKI
ncbi:unnamed protein product [Schistosoma curassoni]|uniref:UBA domain-containing protein n=1 Tax=Schistosoma curassoni TaxID=6186 RepID=A0A183JEI2_9TREM|nr:unnamed protein product [Schistosoma curassoni]